MLIGEVARRSGISARMLRHYDSIGLVSPTGRSGGGYRQYSDDDVRRLFQVEGLRSLGLSLSDVAAALDGRAFRPTELVERLVERTRERIAREEELLGRLERVRASDPGAWSDVLRTIGLMRGLDDGDPSARQRFALSLSGEVDVVTVGEAALGEEDPIVAGALDWVLARAGDDAVPVLAGALASPSADRRRRAVAALSKMDSPAALAALAGAAEHPDPVVRGRAALVRGAGGAVDVVPTLVALVVDGVDDVAAADVLGRLAESHGQAEVIATTIADEIATAPADARRRLATALADVPGPRADGVLARLVDDADHAVALTATVLVRSRQADGGHRGSG